MLAGSAQAWASESAPLQLSLSESVFTTAPAAEPDPARSAPEPITPPQLSTLKSTPIAPSTAAGDLAQVTSVTDFADVSPDDWAFQALSALVERYSCIEGYPDSSFRGNQALTRYEFAAGLSACLDVLTGAITQSSITAEDLATVRRLQEEFADELARLDEQVTALEAATAELEANQFATQTKLRGVVFAHLGGGFASGDIRVEGDNVFTASRDAAAQPVTRIVDQDPSLTFGSLAWINMDTSFTGEDRLNLQFVVGNGTAPSNLYASAGLFNTFGAPFTFQNGGSTPNVFAVRELSYTFPVGDRLTLDVGPRINWYRYFDNNRYTFLITGANTFNSSGGTQVNAVDRGAGAIAVWDVTDWMDFRVGYLAENTEFLPGARTAADPSRGLFGGANTLTAQVGLKPFNDFNLRLLYTRSNLEANAAGQIGGAVSEPLYGFADDGPGGAANGGLTNSPADTFLVNFDWAPTSWLGLFGRYSYGSTHLRQAGTGNDLGDINAQSFQIGAAFPDLFKEGALATVSYLIPFDITGGREFLVSGGGDGGTQQELEISYRYPLTSNIAVVPSFYWIMNANNFSSNPDIFLFNLQTQLFF